MSGKDLPVFRAHVDVFVLVCCYVSDSRFEGLDAEVEAFSGDGGWCCDVEERGFFGYGFFFGLKKSCE